MEKHFAALPSEKIGQYLRETFLPEDEILASARSLSAAQGLPQIQVGDLDSLHLEVLTRAFNAGKAVEIGTLGGYSGIAICRGLGKTGKLYTFEADKNHAAVAQENFKKAGVADQVEIFVGYATEQLPRIEKEGPFDLVFVDADKANYPNYLKWAAENLRVGGAVLGDNTLAWGMIADTKFEDREDEEAVLALRKFNQDAAQGGRFRATMLPTGEGLTLAVKIR